MSRQYNQQFIKWFRESAPYIHRFRGNTFVIAFGGQVIANGHLHSLVQDLALLHSLGIRCVLVHGASPQINGALKRAGVKTEKIKGIRVTNEQAIQVIKEVVGRLRIEIEAALSMGLVNSPMEKSKVRISSGNFVVARPLGVVAGVDFRYTGVIRSVDKEVIQRHLEMGEMALLSPLGYSVTGEVFNIHHQDIATTLAVALRSHKLIIMMDEAGLFDDKGELIRELILEETQDYLNKSGQRLTDDLKRTIQLCIKVCKEGVRRAHLISHNIEGSLLRELFTRDGIGTMITSDSYASIRQATTKDIAGILRLIRPMEEHGFLIKRDRESLEIHIDQFYVVERDSVIVACAMLTPYEGQMAEIGSLVVETTDQDRGKGKDILIYIEKQARIMGIKTLFALTTQTTHWFIEQGYVLSSFETLPQSKRKNYNRQRNPKVLMKALN